MTTKLFNFVSLRGVQRHSASAHAVVSVTAPEGFAPDPTLLPSPERRADPAAFPASGDFLATPADVTSRFGPLGELGDRLSRAHTTEEASAVARSLAELKPLSPNVAAQLWNNLVYQALYGMDDRTYDRLAAVARADYVTRQLGAGGDRASSPPILSWVTAAIALPKAILPRLPAADPGPAPALPTPPVPAGAGAGSLIFDRGSRWPAEGGPHADPAPRPDQPIHFPEYDPFPFLPCCMNVLNVAEYRRADLTLVRYESGEIATTTNIMAGEYQERSTRRLLRTEDTFLTRTETETTRESDSETTSRYDLETESKKEFESSLDLSLNATVSGNYGATSFASSVGVASHVASSQSDKQVVKASKEITSRALDRVVEKVAEERRHTRIEEFEDKFLHGYDNRDGADHVVGSYRWINKVYSAQVWTYGRRLAARFLVDEPARFYKFAQANSPLLGNLTKPVRPAVTDATGVTEANYLALCSPFGVDAVEPPAEFVYVSKSYSNTNPSKGDVDWGELDFSGAGAEIVIPKGWAAVEAFVRRNDDTGEVQNEYYQITIAGQVLSGPSGTLTFPAPGISTSLTPSFIGRNRNWFISIRVKCRRTDQAYRTWQLKTYAAVMAAYNAELDAYNAKVAQAEASARSLVFNADDQTIRRIISAEVRKACLRILGPDKDLPLVGAAEIHRCEPAVIPLNRTACDFCADAARAILVDSMIDWDLMTIELLDYYYANICRWAELSSAKGSDASMTAFLQAGLAKVTVPIADGMEAAFLYYMATGQLWGSDNPPVFDDEVILDILADIQPLDEPVAVGDPWDVWVPTTLTVLECGSKCIVDTDLPLVGTMAANPHILAGKDVALPSVSTAAAHE